MRKRAQKLRALVRLAADAVLLEQSPVAGLVLLLDVIEKRTAGRHQLQKTTTGMVVLGVGLEVFGEVGDALRKDGNLDLGRTGIAGLEGAVLDDFRFAFCGNRHRQWLSFWTGLAVNPERLNTRLGMSSPLLSSARASNRPDTVT